VKRETTIQLYQVDSDEKPWLYERGIPVVKLHGSMLWHVNVLQKVPQTTSRSVVSEIYLKDLYGAILNNSVELLTEENSGSTFVQIGMKSAKPEIAKQVFKNVFGTEQVYIQSKDDHRANEKAIESGGTLIKTGFLDREARTHLEQEGVLERAGETFETNYASARDYSPNEDMVWFADVFKEIMKDTIGEVLPIEFKYSKEVGDLAWLGEMLGNKFMGFNVALNSWSGERPFRYSLTFLSPIIP